MLTDEWYTILLHSSITDLNQLCYINKNIFNICIDKHYWDEKFNHDLLSIITPGENINQWINEYNKVNYASNVANNLILSILKNSIEIYFLFIKDDDVFKFLPIALVNSIKENKAYYDLNEIESRIAICFHIYAKRCKTNHNTIEFIKDKNRYFAFHDTPELTLNELNSIMLHMFYYHPSIKPVYDIADYL